MSDPPLQIKCTDSECESDLHCFRPKSWKKPEAHPRCRDCGADLVEWERLHRRDLEDCAFLFAELPKELVRHHFWHCEIPERTHRSAEYFSREVIARRTRGAIRARVSDAANDWDGTQTPMDPEKGAQIYHFGMHATACCCRKCMQYWHGIPRERPLTEEELDYFSTLVWLYVCTRMGWQESEGLIKNVD
jgi:ribosomal protein L34E